VADAKTVVDRPAGPKGTGSKIAECIVGDSTAAILLQARDDQGEGRGREACCPVSLPARSSQALLLLATAVEVAKPGTYLRLEGAKVEVFRGSMRLVVDKAGSITAVTGEDFRPAVSPWVVRCRLQQRAGCSRCSRVSPA
jgi:hypothetical protein